MAVAGGRYAMVPAALGFGAGAGWPVRADLSLVLADARERQGGLALAARSAGESPRTRRRTPRVAAVLPVADRQ